MKIKAGDLVETRNGNLAIVIATDHIEKGWSDILFCDTGYFRTGFFNSRIRRVVRCK